METYDISLANTVVDRNFISVCLVQEISWILSAENVYVYVVCFT